MSFEKKYKSEIDILFKILQEHVKEKFSLDFEDIEEIKNKSRKEELVYFRKMMMVILGETYCSKPHNFTQQDIADVVGKDRTSFIHHSKNHLNDYNQYADYKAEYDKIREKFDEQTGNQ